MTPEEKAAEVLEKFERWNDDDKQGFVELISIVCDGMIPLIKGISNTRPVPPNLEEVLEDIATRITEGVEEHEPCKDLLRPILRDIAPECFIEAAIDDICELLNPKGSPDIGLTEFGREELKEILRFHLREAAPLEGELGELVEELRRCDKGQEEWEHRYSCFEKAARAIEDLTRERDELKRRVEELEGFMRTQGGYPDADKEERKDNARDKLKRQV